MTARTRTANAATRLAAGIAITTASMTAAGAQGLPGGASSLTETHGDWTVTCQNVSEGDGIRSACTMSQQQRNQQNQRAIAVELVPSEDGVRGALVLPFGVAVTETVTLAVDEESLGNPRSFSTCLPVGCVVPVTITTESVDRMKVGTTLAVTARPIEGETFTLRVSLDGFTSALDRSTELTQ